MNLADLHIEPAILPTTAKCAVCSEKSFCHHYDRDLRGYVCDHCSGFVIVVEAFLRKFFAIKKP